MTALCDGRSLRFLRRLAGMKTGDVARLLGVPKWYHRGVEAGTVRPSKEYLFAATTVIASRMKEAA